MARRDPFFQDVIEDLESYGYHIKHPFYGPSGAYIPDESPARFILSTRYGRAQNLHYFLHELMHFWQDLNGLLPTQKNIVLGAESHLELNLFCEAIAEVEAIRASWRLKQLGQPQAWQGACSSLDWGWLARVYQVSLTHMDELAAARSAMKSWYQSGKRRYYEARSKRQFNSARSDVSTSINIERLKTIWPDYKALKKAIPKPQSKKERS